ncbi:MAG: TdeIII family type II restriction endonuclease, partial [Methanobacterium sp.]
MSEQNEMRDAIQEVVQTMMDGVMEKVLYKDPFIPDLHHALKPIYAALVPDEIFKSAHFERRFVTPFGSVWEKLAVVAATKGLGYGIKGKRIEGMICEERLRRITEILNRLEHSKRGQQKQKPDWESELNYILAGGGDNKIPIYVECDVYAEDRTNT